MAFGTGIGNPFSGIYNKKMLDQKQQEFPDNWYIQSASAIPNLADEIEMENENIQNQPRNLGLNSETVSFLREIGLGQRTNLVTQDMIEMQNSLLKGEMSAMGQRRYEERQNLLDTQRRYGITGAVAAAQMQDLDLKYNQQIQRYRQQYTANFMRSMQPILLQQASIQDQKDQTAKMSAIRQIGSGEISDVEQLRNFLRVGGASFADTISDEVLENMIDNPDALKGYIRGGSTR